MEVVKALVCLVMVGVMRVMVGALVAVGKDWAAVTWAVDVVGTRLVAKHPRHTRTDQMASIRHRKRVGTQNHLPALLYSPPMCRALEEPMRCMMANRRPM